MNILIIGTSDNLREAQAKFGTKHTYSHVADYASVRSAIGECDAVFDFLSSVNSHSSLLDSTLVVFVNSCQVSLGQVAQSASTPVKCTLFGFNGMPTLLNRGILEVSVFQKSDTDKLASVCADLGTEFRQVDDRVGMVTPRIISMIINEAYYTVQEGTASREDIDIAMKLGTNYPYGPFEWCNRIGLKNVYSLLDAIYRDTRDERYKICPLLKQEFLKL